MERVIVYGDLARPWLLVRRIWLSAVVDERAVRFNLRLLAVLTAVFAVPDLVQGLVTVTAKGATGEHLYGAYVLTLGVVEIGGAMLLARRRTLGRWLLLIAAWGFYVEAFLGLAGFERSLLAALIFAVCAPADAWVIWFLSHLRTRRYIATWLR